ncbi:hypothetical protein NEUTE1DRAFT_122576 [Neurospora tetrasperma FGSC 2508]|uniref:Uncharacterized protein n=1 Tax=Neurospora tetrasperma (strain FGSC 2508 / ATCC MYA-4615 / P0657) TaxID=510951 RepID=F8MKY8_NEUT8|nr:uncharacterized protein NEUTE1DRAFT_122576 [Neurospora tetrasperma FGSC 2508]EGO58313.1 hypothetical protein NEUTE1DRAFT_122576 [Neurospora tetrasperma FGSC 2508]
MPHLSSRGGGLLHYVLDDAEPAAARYPVSPTSPSQKEPLTSSWNIPIVVTGRELKLPSRTMEVRSLVRSPLALGLTKQRAGVLDAFLELCHSRGSLEHPVGLSNEDVRDDLNDEKTTLCYDEHHWQICRKFLRGRPFNPDRAPTQFDEAQEIRSKQAAYDTIGITDFENTKDMPPRRATARTGQLPTRRDGYETTTPENYIVPLTSAVYLVDIASFAFKQTWDTSNDNYYEHQRDRCTSLIHPQGLRVRRLKGEPNCLGMKPA